MRILVVDDDVTLCKNIANMLTLDYYAVDTVHHGDEAIDLLQYYSYDLLVLDWMMPGASGIDICKEARKQQFDGGILMLTAKDANDDIIAGLDAGADDYLVKPFEMAVLRARVRALLRRKNKMMEEQISVGALTLNKGKRSVSIDNVEVHLTKNEFLLLEYLIENKGRILSHEQIIEYVWDLDDDATTNTIFLLNMSVLRMLDCTFESNVMRTLPYGYMYASRS